MAGKQMRVALVLMDLIADLVCRGGAMAGCADAVESRGIIARANTASSIAREAGWPVAMVRVGFRRDYSDAPRHSPVFMRARSVGALQLGTSGTAWHPEFLVSDGDTVFVKKGISAFFRSGLEEWLISHGIECLVMGGVSSAMAVEATARDAHDRGFATVVLEDVCAAAEDSQHEWAMRVCGILGRVIPTAELMETLTPDGE